MNETELAARIEAFCRRQGESHSSFGRRVARDGNLVRDLRQGRSPRLRLVREILSAIELSEKSDAASSDVCVNETERAP